MEETAATGGMSFSGVGNKLNLILAFFTADSKVTDFAHVNNILTAQNGDPGN